MKSKQQQQQQQQQRKRKRSSPLFITFPTSITIFPPFLLQISLISFFSSQFSPIFHSFPFSLAPFFPIRQQKFSSQKGGALCHPPPTCYATGVNSPYPYAIFCAQSSGNPELNFTPIACRQQELL